MEQKDDFEGWFKANLEEETKEISFTAKAREGVRKIVFRHEEQSVDLGNSDHVSFSLRTAISLCLVALVVIGTFYTRTFFYVSPQQLAKLEMREKLILHEEGIPFGSIQQMVASLKNSKGVGRP